MQEAADPMFLLLPLPFSPSQKNKNIKKNQLNILSEYAFYPEHSISEGLHKVPNSDSDTTYSWDLFFYLIGDLFHVLLMVMSWN